MRIQEIMTREVRSVSAGSSAVKAWDFMTQEGIHHLAVMERGKAIGILSKGDLGGPRGESQRQNHTVSDCMTRDPATVPPNTTIRQAANIMRGRSVGSLLVVESGKLVGIVTLTDLLDLIGHGSGTSSRESGNRDIGARGPRPKAPHVAASAGANAHGARRSP